MQNRFQPQIISKNNNKKLMDFFNKPYETTGNIKLILERSPYIWESFKVEGHKSEVLTVIDTQNNAIAGAVILNQKKCFYYGEKIKIGYINSLKVLEKYQGKKVMGLLFKSFRKYCDETKPKLWLLSAFSDNKKAKELFSKKVESGLIFKKIKASNTYIFKKRLLTIENQKEGVRIRDASVKDVDSIIEFLNEESNNRVFLPNYDNKELLNGEGLLNGFNLKNLAIAKKDGSIVGIMGLWDQSGFRRWKVTGYSNLIKFTRFLINVLASFKNLPLLPKINSNVECKILNLVIIKENNQEIFKMLFNYLMKKEEDSNTFSISLASDSPINEFFNNLSIRFENFIYIAYWPENEINYKKLNFRNLYLEQGGL